MKLDGEKITVLLYQDSIVGAEEKYIVPRFPCSARVGWLHRINFDINAPRTCIWYIWSVDMVLIMMRLSSVLDCYGSIDDRRGSVG